MKYENFHEQVPEYSTCLKKIKEYIDSYTQKAWVWGFESDVSSI